MSDEEPQAPSKREEVKPEVCGPMINRCSLDNVFSFACIQLNIKELYIFDEKLIPTHHQVIQQEIGLFTQNFCSLVNNDYHGFGSIRGNSIYFNLRHMRWNFLSSDGLAQCYVLAVHILSGHATCTALSHQCYRFSARGFHIIFPSCSPL